MSLRESVDSINYLTERYVAPHIEKNTVNNKRISNEEAKKLVKKFIDNGMIRFAARKHDELDEFQQNRAIFMREQGETIGTIAYKLQKPYELVRDFFANRK